MGRNKVEQEWKDALFLRYGLETPDLPHYCNGCNTTLPICHSLECKWGGLVTARHNDLRDGVTDLAGKAFTPSHVRNDSLIFTCGAVKRMKENPTRSKDTTVPSDTPPLEATEQKGDLLIHDLWQNGTASVHDMHVGNTYAKSYLAKKPEKYPHEAEIAKKKMYLEACIRHC